MSGPPIVVVAGVGNATGTGAAAAKEFSKALGYRVALVARRLKDLQTVAYQINVKGGQAHSFPLESYTHDNIAAVFRQIMEKWPESRIEVAIWNAAQWSRIPFLEVKEEVSPLPVSREPQPFAVAHVAKDIQRSVQINIVASFAFSQEAIKAMLSPSPAPVPRKSRVGGTLIFTGATSAVRGAANFATFAAGKHGVRALSQSLAREFGRRDIHVTHVIIDGPVMTHRIEQMFGGRQKIAQTPEAEADTDVNWLEDESKRLDPTSIAKNFIWLHLQDRSAWTLELDLRPAKEHF